MARLLQQAREAGAITFLDTVWDDTGRWMKLLKPCLPYVDYFVPGLAEARALTGRQSPEEVATALLEEGVGTVAIKMGADGCLVKSRDRPALRVPAFKMPVVDATGAGDAFAAGFIAGVYLGWPLMDTARFANAVGALCVTGVGAFGNVASLEETLAFMRSAQVREH